MHIVNTSSYTFASFSITLVTMVLTLFIFWLTWMMLQGVNWQIDVTIFDSNWFSSIFTF